MVRECGSSCPRGAGTGQVGPPAPGLTAQSEVVPLRDGVGGGPRERTDDDASGTRLVRTDERLLTACAVVRVPAVHLQDAVA